ncbi:hypothetical protein K7432_014686 [Basidiobolus ranarum]|uniref:LysM domain-containing protein n=1 Tax=Basidiobolus ranarum TaxID=34480 RepID=A0ABR2WH99_9FUNG
MTRWPLFTLIVLAPTIVSGFRYFDESTIPKTLSTACKQVLLKDVNCPPEMFNARLNNINLLQVQQLCERQECNTALSKFAADVKASCNGQVIENVTIQEAMVDWYNINYELACQQDSSKNYCSVSLAQLLHERNLRASMLDEYPTDILCTECLSKRVGLESKMAVGRYSEVDVQFIKNTCNPATYLPLPRPIDDDKDVAYPTPTCSELSYNVNRGDTCNAIMSIFHLELDQLLALNPGLACDRLAVGQKVCVKQIPTITSTTGLPTPTPKDCKEYPKYIIKDYDTCDGIATAMKITRKQLIEANPGLDCWYVPYNQYLCIPSDKPTNPSPPTSTCPIGSRPYTLQSGDTCFAVGISYGVSEDQLKLANIALNCQQIQPGLQLCIPPAQIPTPTIKPATCPTTASVYEIQLGDTCITISLKNNISVASLQISNPQLNCSKPVLGQVICIPKPSVPTSTPPPSCGAGTISYAVKSGDTCSVIAASNGISIEKLLSANPTMKCELLILGQQICIPLLCKNGEKPSPVKAGDTCEKIATSWKVTLDQLLKSNIGLDCKTLIIGQLICQPGTGTITPIPTTTTSSPVSSVVSSTASSKPTVTPPPTCTLGTTSYTVRSGDTCGAIAARNTITVEKLLAANPNMKCELLMVDQIICIPSLCQNNDKPSTSEEQSRP